MLAFASTDERNAEKYDVRLLRLQCDCAQASSYEESRSWIFAHSEGISIFCLAQPFSANRKHWKRKEKTILYKSFVKAFWMESWKIRGSSRGKIDKDPYKISTMENGSLW